ncbi:MAG: outer membrane beta-barrel protein [Rhodobacteraceae bacterium]|nr:outer membrane beta-barrel protein [Paracoccaceae bacterium]
MALTVSATAGSIDAPAPDALITMPAPTGADWSGFYGGANVGFASGNLANFHANSDVSNNTLFGVFAGYNMQRGNIVFGGELDYTITPIEPISVSTPLNDTIDAKARVGYALGNALVYGVVGYLARNLNGDFNPPA